MNILDVMTAGPVIPVIVLERVDDAVPLARALVAGGLKVLEVTLRTPVALEAVAAIVAAVPEAIVGTGTAVCPEDVERSRAAGAAFVVSPGYTAAVGAAAKAAGVPLLPGVSTASEIMAALADGFAELKFFPAMQAGGIAMLKALAGPFPHVTFCPTGGIGAEDFRDFLALSNVACVGGSWVVPKDAIAGGDWARITRLAHEACAG